VAAPHPDRRELREHLKRVLTWNDAHVGFDLAVKGLAPALRGRVPKGFPYSAWQLVEHLRLAQHDILDFCVNPDYRALRWPEDYWPAEPAPPNARACGASLRAVRADRASLVTLAMDSSIDLFARIPYGSGQTYLRELLLVADHNAYHVGELVALRRLMGAWKSS